MSESIDTLEARVLDYAVTPTKNPSSSGCGGRRVTGSETRLIGGKPTFQRLGALDIDRRKSVYSKVTILMLANQRIPWHRWTRARLTLIFGGAAILTSVLTGLAADFFLTRYLLQLSGQSLQTISQPIAIALAEGMQEREREMLLLSSLPMLTRSDLNEADNAQLQSLLDQIKQSFPFYSWIGLTDAKGTVVRATGRLLEGLDVSSREWFSGGSLGPFVGDAHNAQLLDKYLRAPGSTTPLRFMDYAAPVRGQDSAFKGVIAAHVNGEWIYDLINRARSQSASEAKLEVMVVNKEGMLDSSGAIRLPRNSLPQLPEPGNYAVVQWTAAGDEFLTTVQPVPSLTSTNLNWLLVTRQPLQAALAPVHHVQWIVGVLTVLSTLALIGGAYWAATVFSKPIEQLAQAVRRVEVTGDVTALEVKLGTEEFQQLGSALHHMTTTLIHQRVALEETNAALETRVADRTADLYRSEQRYLTILQYQTEIICRFDADGTMTFVNDAFCRLFGLASEEVVGTVWAPVVHPDDLFMVKAKLEGVSPDEPSVSIENRVMAGDGTVRWCHFNNRAFFDQNGKVLEWQAVGRDVTELKIARQKLQELLLEQHAMLDNDLIGIAKLKDRIIEWHNPAMARLFGYGPGALQGKTMEVLHPNLQAYEAATQRERAALAEEHNFREQRALLKSNGDEIWIDANAVALDEDGSTMCLMQDVTAMKLYQQQVEHMAFHDELTGLPNRLLLADRMAHTFAICERSNEIAAVCFMDLNGFKPVNDQYGHEAGDVVLRTTGKRLQAQLRAADTAARVGGDEFVLLLAPLSSADEVEPVLARLKASIEVPIDIGGGVTVRVSSAFGVAFYPASGSQPSELLRKADEAMYANKHGANGNAKTHPI